MRLGCREPLQQLGGSTQDVLVVRREQRELTGQGLHTTSPTLLEDADPPLRRDDSLDASVRVVRDPFDESAPFQFADCSRHGGRPYLLGRGEVAHPHGAGEDDHGQGGQSRGRQPARLVVDTESAEQVDGGRVEPIGDIERGRARVAKTFIVLSVLTWCIVTSIHLARLTK